MGRHSIVLLHTGSTVPVRVVLLQVDCLYTIERVRACWCTALHSSGMYCSNMQHHATRLDHPRNARYLLIYRPVYPTCHCCSTELQYLYGITSLRILSTHRSKSIGSNVCPRPALLNCVRVGGDRAKTGGSSNVERMT